jgi:hypothetical protein
VYSQELNKIMKSKKSGAGTDDLHSQNWCGLTSAGDFYGILYLMRPTHLQV